MYVTAYRTFSIFWSILLSWCTDEFLLIQQAVYFILGIANHTDLCIFFTYMGVNYSLLVWVHPESIVAGMIREPTFTSTSGLGIRPDPFNLRSCSPSGAAFGYLLPQGIWSPIPRAMFPGPMGAIPSNMPWGATPVTGYFPYSTFFPVFPAVLNSSILLIMVLACTPAEVRGPAVLWPFPLAPAFSAGMNASASWRT